MVQVSVSFGAQKRTDLQRDGFYTDTWRFPSTQKPKKAMK
jgi:hypothetical protein